MGDATPHKLIAMLFDGAIAALQRARVSMAAGDVAGRGEAVARAIRIVDEGLRASLDPRAGEIAANLRELYDYIGSRLLTASLRNDPEPLEEAARLLGELQAAWAQIAPDRQRAALHAVAG